MAKGGVVRSKAKTSSGVNPSHATDVDEPTRSLTVEEDHSVLEEIRRKFPRFDPSKAKFIFGEDNFGRVYVELKRKGGKRHFFYDADGNLNEELPDSITDGLGPFAEEINVERDVKIGELRKVNEELRKTNKGRRSLLRGVLRENEEKLMELRNKTVEDEARISDLEGEKMRLEREKDEALKRAKEDYEAKLERLEKNDEAFGKERDESYDDKITNSKKNYEEHIREITNVYEERIREKDTDI